MTGINTQSQELTIIFTDAAQGHDSIIKITPNGMISAPDLVMAMTGKSRKHAGQDIRRLADDIFDSKKFIEGPPRIGSFLTKYVSLPDSIDLIMLLPGRVAKKTRVQFGNIIRQYISTSKITFPQVGIQPNPITNTSSCEPAIEEADSYTVNESISGNKRSHEEFHTQSPSHQILTRQMDFIDEAFRFQKKALELRHYRDMKILENEYQTEDIIDLLHNTKLENNHLKQTIEEIDNQNQQLETEANTIEAKQENIRSQISEEIETIRILIGPYIHGY
jgi:hypothetical protein